MRPASLCLAASCLAAIPAGGCGSSQSGLSPSQGAILRSRLAAVASGAGRGDRAEALAALAAVSSQVNRDGPQLTADQRAALATGIAHLRTRIDASTPAAAPTATTPTATTPTATTPTATVTATATASSPAAPGPGPAPPGRGPDGHGPPGQRGRHGPAAHGPGERGGH